MRGFNVPKSQRLPDLGEREVLVLEVLWCSTAATAQAVHSEMPDGDISLSTVQTTLERLHRKRLVRRSKQGRAYCYRAALDKSELISGLLGNMAEQLTAGDLAPMISGFLNYVSTRAPELGHELSKSLSKKQAAAKVEPDADDD